MTTEKKSKNNRCGSTASTNQSDNNGSSCCYCALSLCLRQGLRPSCTVIPNGLRAYRNKKDRTKEIVTAAAAASSVHIVLCE